MEWKMDSVKKFSSKMKLLLLKLIIRFDRLVKPINLTG